MQIYAIIMIKYIVKDDTISSFVEVAGIAGKNIRIINNCEVYNNQGLIICTKTYGRNTPGRIIGYNDGGTHYYMGTIL